MGIRSLIVKIGADTQAIEQALAKVGASTKNLDEGLKKLGNTPIGKQAQQDAERWQKSLDAVRAAQERVAQGGQLAARGLEAIGGPARLTRSELDQMNRSVQNSLDAYRALGREAPKELQKVAAAIQQQQRVLQSSSVLGRGAPTSALSGLLSGLPGGSTLSTFATGGLAAGAATAATAGGAAFALAAKQALDYADALTKISDTTRISTTALQRIEAVASASGNSLDDVARGVSQFQRRLAEGNADTVRAISEIGLSVNRLRALSPDEQLFAIANGFKTIKDPANEARLAFDLFGKAGVEILPTLKADVDKLKDSTVVMSAESIKALDDLGDSIGRLFQNAKVIAGEGLGLLIRGTTFGSNLSTIRAEAARAVQEQQDLFASIPGRNVDLLPGAASRTAGTDLAELSRLLQLGLAEDLARVTAELQRQRGAASAAGLSLDAYRSRIETISTKLQQAQRPIVELTDRQRALVETYRTFGLSTDEIALQLGVSTRSITLYITGLDQLRASLKRIEDVSPGVSSTLRLGRVEDLQGLRDRLKLTDQLAASLAKIEQQGIPAVFTQGGLDKVGIQADVVAPKIAKVAVGIDDLARSIAQLAQVSGRSFGGILQGLAQIVAAVDVAKKSFTLLNDPKSGLLGKAAGGIGLLEAGFQVGQLLFHAFRKTEAEKLAFDTGRDLGVQISDGLAQQLEADSQRFGRQATQLLHLDQIIGEAGGVEAFGFTRSVRAARDLFSLLETGQLTTQQVGASLDRVFSQLVPSALSKTSRLASAAFVELQTLALSRGIAAPSIDQFRSGQIQGSVLGGLDQFLASGTTIGSQGAASGLGDALAAAFAEMARQGGPVLDIIAELDPLIGRLSQRLIEAGLGGGFAFDTIFQSAALAKDEVAGPALQAIDGLGRILAGLSNTGLLTQDTFLGLTTQVGETFRALQQQGKGGADALVLVQQPLQTIFELQQRTGFAVDEATQALLDQAVAQGIVGDQFKTSQERTIDALNRTNTILVAIADVLGATLPAAARTGADKITQELDRIQVPDLTIDVGFEVEPFPRVDPSRGPIYLEGAATGGLVTASGIQPFAGGGRVLPFLPRGTDTVPAMLTPGEVVLNAAQQQNVSGAIAQSAQIVSELRLLRALLLTQPATRIEIDGREVVRASHTRYDRNQGGERTDLQSLLGVA